MPFDPERWRKLNALLDELLDLPADQRNARLAELQDQDPDMTDELQQFLNDATQVEGFLSVPAGESAASLIDEATQADAPESRLGQTLGPWELTGILGEGGMGVVYRARRADGQYEAQAAIKLMLAVHPSSPLRSRLLAERQMLARLDDPRIAHLYDGGLSEDGHPYLVMELVEGTDILDHCARNHLGLAERLTIFGEVCAAVHSAHRQMILHCDLKPSNIMVTQARELKLLDFGVARPINEAAPSSHLLTPGYASPEQLAGQPLTAASDVFALGILLHELVTGSKPQDGKLPHQAAHTLPWARRLRGDLDNIMLKALAREPADRYATVHALDEDLDRWAARLPVRATRNTFGYRLRRRIDRNRLATSALVLITLAVATGLGTTIWQAREATSQRDQAQREALRARTVSSFLLDLFNVSDPNENQGADLTARDILDRGRIQVNQLADDPQQRIVLRDVLADVYFRLGLFEESRELFAAQLVDDISVHGDPSAEVSDTRLDLAVTLLELGLAEEAAEQVGLCLEYRLANPQTDPQWLSIPYSIKARIASEQRDFVEAVRIYQETLPELDPADPALQPTLARAWTNYGVALNGLGRIAASDSAYARAEVHFQVGFPPHHSYFGSLYNNWALVVHTLGDLDRAEELHRKSLDIRRRLKHNRVDIGTSLINLGNLLVEKGQADDAVPLLEEAVAIQRNAFGEAHVYVAAAEINLGMAFLAQGDPGKADRRFQTGEQIFRELYGEDNPALAVALTRRAQAARAAHQLDQAAAFLDQSLAMHRRHLPNFQHKFGLALLEAGQVEEERHHPNQAADLALEALTILTETVGPDHPQVQDARELLRRVR
jgi:tetratricopeptide (TPR) repeat protein